MKNLWNFIKDKSYYFLGGTVIIIILVIIISSCSGGSGNSYEEIEEKMVSAATSYYEDRENALPKEDGGSVRVSIASLVEAELLNEVTDPNDSSNVCSGYVEVTKVGDEYSYVPFLVCEGNYEPEYLVDKIKEVKTDELGNGVYTINDEYVYRGADVDNYVSFNDILWRIIKIDKEGDIKLVKAERTSETYSWDTKYNSESDTTSGNTTDYLLTDIRQTLNTYYEETFTKENKSKIISKDICVGRIAITDDFNAEKECSVIKEDEKVSLLNATDYQNASLDTGCTNLSSNECINRNYLASDNIYTWLLNASSQDTYRVLYLYSTLGTSYASNERRINPVIYLSGKVITSEGKGTLEDPYVIK